MAAVGVSASRQVGDLPRTAGGWTEPAKKGLAVVVAAFAATWALYAAMGVRFDASALHPATALQDQWQLLDLQLLQHDLLKSIWFMHSQPPLYNLFSGVLLQFPRSLQVPLAATCFFLLGVLLVCSTYLLALELGTPVWVAVLVALLVVADPATVLYANWLSWTYPAAALITAGTYCFARYIRTGRAAWGVTCFACFCAVVLDDTTFQWPWLVAAITVAVLWRTARWRQVLLVALAPCLIVSLWYVKDAALFGTASTSSWLGMNLASTTVALAPEGQLRRLVRQGRLDELASVPAFGPVGRYEPRFVKVRHTGVRALDEPVKSDGAVNYNNLVYVTVSEKYLRDDLAFVRADPAAFAGRAALSTEVWFIPSDQYGSLNRNRVHISAYANFYDKAVLWQTGSNPHELAAVFAATTGTPPGASRMSFLKVLELALTLVLGPLLVVLRRRDTTFAATLTVIVLTVAYSFVVTSLVSLIDNARFSFELGSLPLVASAAILASLAGRGGAYRRAPRSSLTAVGPGST